MAHLNLKDVKKQKEKMSVYAQILGKEDSLADIKPIFTELLQKQGSDSVVLVSDVDGTITTGAGLAGGMKATAAERTRGGQATLDFFRWLQDNKIRWFANSARAQSLNTAASVAGTLYKQLELQGTPFGGECLYVKGKESKYNQPQFWAAKREYKNTLVWTCNNMVSAAKDIGGLAYDKDIAVDFILQEYVRNRPVTVVFTDDNAKNNVAVYEYFAAQRPAGVQICSIHLLPTKPEGGHAEGLLRLEEIIRGQPC